MYERVIQDECNILFDVDNRKEIPT
jgi:hypothetical protein